MNCLTRRLIIKDKFYHLSSVVQIVFFVFIFNSFRVSGQSFPNPATLSTGQGMAGEADPLWLVSPWYTDNPPNPIGLEFGPALINNNCAPGAWVNPADLPPPINNGNWITGTEASCADNSIYGYRYFRLTLNLPADCNGNSIINSDIYVLELSGYVDNQIANVYVNGVPTGISGGDYSFGGQLNMTLSGPWVSGLNYVDVLVFNAPGAEFNPYGLLLVANSEASSLSDLDGDGISDLDDLCPCQPGLVPDGCALFILGDNSICNGESTTLYVPTSANFSWSNGSINDSIIVSPTQNTSYSVDINFPDGSVSNLDVDVLVHANYEFNQFNTICQGEEITIAGVDYNQSGIYPILLQSTFGCDSLVTLHLNVLQSGFSEQNIEACDSFTWNGVVYNSSGTYSYQLITANGCDSTAILNLIVHPLQEFTETIAACDSYFWQVSNQTYSSSGDYTVTIPDEFGCPATYDLQLDILNTPASPQLTSTVAECPGDTIVISAIYAADATIHWIGPSGFVSDLSSFSIVANEDQMGTYYSFLEDGNCHSDTIALSVDFVNVNHLLEQEFPNVLTINNDDFNEILNLDSYFSSCAHFSLTLFNRWGKKMFVQTEDSPPFDGKTADGELLSSGVYYYLLEHESGQQSGFIYIIH
jgi:gliding motility-associated-like protein